MIAENGIRSKEGDISGAEPSGERAWPKPRHGRPFAARSRRGLASALLVLVLWPAASTRAQTEAPPWEETEATFLHRVAGYIEWPDRAFAHAGSPIVVGVVGSQGLAASLSRLASGRLVQGRPVEVRQLSEPDEVAKVHLLYLGSPVWGERARWMAVSAERQPLVATNAPDGVDQGAAIGVVHVGRRLRIEASLPAADKAGVRLSSRLLVLAERVVGHPK